MKRMKSHWIFILGVALALTAVPVAAYAQSDSAKAAESAQTLEDHFMAVSDRVGPAVVSISTEVTAKVPARKFHFGPSPFSQFDDDVFDRFFRDFFGDYPEREFKQKGLGTGVIIDEEGYILTNEHVVHNADKLTVTLPDGREFEATIKGTDFRSDLAVIKIDAAEFPAARLGDSDRVRIGQWAIAIGNPFGWAVGGSEPTLTVGVISALNRSLAVGRQNRDYSDLIQTDAAINPGNSGGPLVNIKGEVIGINVAIFSTTGAYEGIGFAIPVNDAKAILGDLIEGKKILYGWLGIKVQDVTDELAEHFGLKEKIGVIVGRVLDDSPAQKGGMKDGDVIVEYDGQPLKDVRELLKRVAKTPVGKKINLQVVRDGRKKAVKVEVGERPDELERWEEKSKESWRGLKVSDLTDELTDRFRLDEKKGVVITEVEPASPAAEAGLRTGDVILGINRKSVRSVRDFESLSQRVRGEALIKTSRGYVVLRGEEE